MKKQSKKLSPKELYFEDGSFKAILLREDFLDTHDIVYCQELGFLMFNGQYWKRANETYIGHILDNMLDDETSNSRIKEVIGLIQKKQNIDVTDINSNRNMLVLKNGTLDITDWANPIFYENEYFKDDLATIQLNVKYTSDIKTPVWNKYLETTFDYEENIKLIIGEMLGYCLQPKCNLEKAFILFGEGSNGKSKILNIIDYIWTEDNIAEVPMNDLDKTFSRSSIYNKLINKSSELQSSVKDTAYFKKLVSGEYINCQFKYKDEFKFKNMAKMIFSMNKLPEINDNTDGLHRRLVIIPFLNKFEGKAKDINLDEKLQSEADGIFMFALEGLKRLGEEKNFTYSEKVQELLNTYKKDNNPIMLFFDDETILNESKEISCKKLYNLYKDYCRDCNHLNVVNEATFGKELKKKFPEVNKVRKMANGKRDNYYVGITSK